jgi:hypothetical protein
MVTQSSVEHAFPWTEVTDRVTITGTNGGQGTIAWQLLGPVKIGASGCASADWTAAPVVATGTSTITGDGDMVTGPATLKGPGCYSWSDTLTAATNPGFPSPVVHQAGSAHEVISVVSTTPTIATKAEVHIDGTTTSLTDSVTITGLGNDGQGPIRASYSWTLVGPIAQENGSCAQLDWSGASNVATGVQQIVGDGTTTTRAVPITAQGCYSFHEELSATENSAEARSAVGQPLETFYLAVAEPQPQPKPPLPLTGFNVGKLLLWAVLLGAFGILLLAAARRLRIER